MFLAGLKPFVDAPYLGAFNVGAFLKVATARNLPLCIVMHLIPLPLRKYYLRQTPLETGLAGILGSKA
jgi:hypothetical protein